MNENRFILTRYTKRPEISGRYFYLTHPLPTLPLAGHPLLSSPAGEERRGVGLGEVKEPS